MKASTPGFVATTGQELPAFTLYDTNNEKLFPGISAGGFPQIDAFYGINGIITVGVQIHSVAKENFHRIELNQFNIGPGTSVFQTSPDFPSAAVWVPVGDYTIPSGFGGSEFSLSAAAFMIGRIGSTPGVDLIEMRCAYEHDSGTNQNIDQVWVTVQTWPEGTYVDP